MLVKKLKPLKKHNNFVAIPHRQMVARLSTIPLEHCLIEEFYELFRRWSDNSGPVWTVDRIKAFRDCVMQSRSAKGKLTSKPPWVASTKAGNLRGFYSRLFDKAMASYKGFKAVLNLLNIYTVWRQKTVTLTDLKQVEKNVSVAPVVTGSKNSPGARTLRKMLGLWSQKGIAFNEHPHREMPERVACKKIVPLAQVLPGKRTHVASVVTSVLSMKQSSLYGRFPEVIRQAIGGRLVDVPVPRDLENTEIRKHLHETALKQMRHWDWTDAEDYLTAGYTLDPSTRDDLLSSGHYLFPEALPIPGNPQWRPVGQVNCTLEPGLKVRYFAAPNQVIQRATQPLQQALGRFLKRLPWDCTFHQRRADGHVLDAMRTGKTVHTVDMSKATDNFPWEYQKAVLQRVMATRRSPETADQVQFFIELIEKGDWELGASNIPFMQRPQPLRWRKGQPLGANPSFFLFTITHGLVLWALNDGNWDNSFFVLGDDVIILDDDLAAKYKKWLKTVDISMSVAKSFSSTEVGQFAGKTYTPYGSFWTPKWVAITKENILDVHAWWYRGLSSWFPKDRELIDQVLALPAPYGNGWNPKGQKLSERLSPHIIDEMVKREAEKLAEASPSSHSCSPENLRLAVKVAGANSELGLRCLDTWVEPRRRVVHSTEHTLTVPLRCYAPGTEVHGFPHLRFSERVDPYTKGTLTMWRKLLVEKAADDKV